MVVNRGPFGCPSCFDSFGSPMAVNSHFRAKHGSFCCPECDHEFWSEEAMEQHYDAEHRFECPICDDEFTTEGARDWHYNAVHLWVKCPECGSEFRTQAAMNQHYDAKHRIECPDCDDEFTTRAAMYWHYDATHRLIECPECGREFKTKERMDQHYDAKHRFECHYCYKHYTTESARDQHREANHRFRCVHCPEIFTTESVRTKHYETKHNFPCPKCGKRFVTISGLEIHEEGEHRSYPCPKCPEIFKTAVAMNEHVEHKHKPLPPPPAKPMLQRLAPGSGKPDRTKGDGVKSPPRAPAIEATERTGLCVANLNQDQEVAPTDRFYCQDEDCGRGFSTQWILDTHVKFFHPKKGDSSLVTPKGTVSVGGTPDDAKGKVGRVKSSVQHTSGLSFVTTGSDSKDASTDIATQFRCRICDKPPSVGTRPAATFCGHLFCYKCIMTKVTSTSKCPVCSTSTLADRIFELDISC